MIIRFTVKSFKSLEDVTVDLGVVNVFIGPNGSGKTNLLEALGVLGAAANGRVDDEALQRRGVRLGLPVLYQSSFQDTQDSEAIRFIAETENASYEVGLHNPLDNPKPSWAFYTEKLIAKKNVLIDRSHLKKKNGNPEAGRAALEMVDMEPDSPAAKLLDLLQNFNLYTPNTDVLRGVVPDPRQREPVGLSGGRLPEAVSEVVKDYSRFAKDLFSLIDWVKAIRTISKPSISAVDASQAPLSPSVPSTRKILTFEDKYMKEGRNLLTGYDVSEGSLYILFNIVLAFHAKSPKLFAIDNADHGLNPRLARRLMEGLCQWYLRYRRPFLPLENNDDTEDRQQILLTTHNPLVLDGLPLLDDRIRLFTVDRSNQGKTVINRVQVNEELMDRAKEGWTLSRLWTMGHLGGVPNV